MLSLVASAILLASQAAAHGGVVSYTIDGVLYKGYQTMAHGASDVGPNRLLTKPPGGPTIQHEWKQLHPIRDLESKLIACNSPGTPGKIAAPVKAGGSIKAQWSQWPHQSGPVTVYMAECPGDCASVAPSSLDWFKIYQAGLLAGTSAHGKWGASEMIKNDNSLTVKIPMLKPANYLIRHETINLAQANPEFYMECAQIKVTGSGTLTPPKSVKVTFPGAYSKKDSQLFRSSAGAIKDTAQWPVPGPPVWTGAGEADAPVAAPKTPKAVASKGKVAFVDESDFVDITYPLSEDLA